MGEIRKHKKEGSHVTEEAEAQSKEGPHWAPGFPQMELNTSYVRVSGHRDILKAQAEKLAMTPPCLKYNTIKKYLSIIPH